MWNPQTSSCEEKNKVKGKTFRSRQGLLLMTGSAFIPCLCCLMVDVYCLINCALTQSSSNSFTSRLDFLSLGFTFLTHLMYKRKKNIKQIKSSVFIQLLAHLYIGYGRIVGLCISLFSHMRSKQQQLLSLWLVDLWLNTQTHTHTHIRVWQTVCISQCIVPLEDCSHGNTTVALPLPPRCHTLAWSLVRRTALV